MGLGLGMLARLRVCKVWIDLTIDKEVSVEGFLSSDSEGVLGHDVERWLLLLSRTGERCI